MLQVKNLCKQYSTKKHVITNALDNVSLTFPETGMVFILGKSGSGKSTLLNVCGGLDQCTSGEIIIKGKSSADFSPSDFDSYRNTYVGFVFQEYNILEDFTVEENVALALELQNKPPHRDVIDRILAEVEMTEFAARKPNTLSGGQKQRVAIARALVKEPQIIMADEPTGALDSQTGEQVFETLKRLSRDKLVLVVSHDREFAEQYADRIIELKDGKVISDVVRTQQRDDSPNVTFYGGDTVCVKDGAILTDKEMDDIKNFLSKSVGSVEITTSREKVAALDNSLPQAKAGVFEQISEQPQSKQYGEQNLIRSKLPLRHAVRMGASSLKTKPVRLTFTILLSVIAFILFGLSSTLMFFNDKRVTTKTLVDVNDDYIVLSKAYYQTEKHYSNGELDLEDTQKFRTSYTLDEYKSLREKYPGALAAVYTSAQIQNVSILSNAEQFYTTQLSGYVIADDSMKLLAGRLPRATDEIAITDFIFDSFTSRGAEFVYYANGVETALEVNQGDYDKVLFRDDNPVTLCLNGEDLKIVGVVKGSEVPSEYADLRKAANESMRYTGNGDDITRWGYAKSSGMYARCVVTEQFVLQRGLDNGVGFNSRYCFESIFPLDIYVSSLQVEDMDEPVRIVGIAEYDPNTGRRLVKMYDMQGNELTSLQSDEIVVSYQTLSGLYRNVLRSLRDQHGENYNDLVQNDDLINQLDHCTKAGLNKNEILPLLETARNLFVEMGVDMNIKLSSRIAPTKDVKIVGIMYGNDAYGYAYVGDEIYDTFRENYGTYYYSNYYIPEDAYVSSVFIPYNSNRSTVAQVVNLTYERNSDDSSAEITNYVMNELRVLLDVAKTLSTVFLIAGLSMAAFAFLLMFNFISVSITFKKKAIGILRAIGARTADVFKIFLLEALIIAFICFVIATAGTWTLCAVLNSVLTKGTSFHVSVFVFSPLSALSILAIAALTAVVSTVIPVALYSRKPPVESIRAL